MTRERIETKPLQGRSGRTAAAAAVSVAGEALVLLAAFSADVPPSTLIALHLATLSCVAGVLVVGRNKDEDTAVPALVLMAVAVGGPAGAVASLASLPFQGALGKGPGTLSAWYDRLANAGAATPSAELLERIASGRVQRPEAPLPQNFLEVVKSGTLDERQRALGLVARRFHPDYAPVLEAALRSPEPVVRVQASAVVARVREDLKARVAALTRSPEKQSLRQTLKELSELQALQSCSLLEASQRGHCSALGRGAVEVLFAKKHDLLSVIPRADTNALAAIEAFLVREQRYKELRAVRRISRIATRSLLHIRRLRAERSAA